MIRENVKIGVHGRKFIVKLECHKCFVHTMIEYHTI